MASFKSICILFIIIIISGFSIRAQQLRLSFTVRGIVTDNESGGPLEFATISIKKLRDSSLVSGTISGPTGEFIIADLPPGGYNIEIAFIGFEKYSNKVFFRPNESPPVNDLGKIILKPGVMQLKEAQVTAEKSFVMNNIDRKTYNTEQLSVATGGNVTDVLQNIPSVEVDADGGVSLRGNENVTILIDGRPSGMTGSGGKSLLESIPSSAIEKVEVITNPSAKYDPDGISGIINIITKKNKLQGFTGTVGATTSFGGRYSANTTLSYRKGKWNVYTNYGFNKDVRKNTGKSYRETYFNDVTLILKQDDIGTSNRLNHNVKFGTDYNITAKSILSASALVNFQDGKNNQSITYRLFDGNNIADSLYKRKTDGVDDDVNADFDLAFKHNFKQDGRLINFQGTASIAQNNSSNEYNQLGYYNDQIPYLVPPDLQNDFVEEDNMIYTASADYEHPLMEDKKIEGGFKSIFREFDTDFRSESFDDFTGQFENDVNLTNRFIYNDQVHAVYIQYRQSMNKFGFQAGMRSEYATTESELVTTSQKFNKDYFSIFPSAFVTYKTNDKSQLKATYSRRINRPRKNNLNPFADYDDPLNIRKGNPYLDPEYTDSYELEYSRYFGKLSLTATGYIRLTKDYIQRYRQVTPEGITITTFENLAEAKNYGLEMILNGSPYKWWNMTFSTNMFKNELDATNLQDDLSTESFSISGRIFTTFKMPYSTELQISYSYRAPMKVTQGTMKDMQNTTVAVSKKILKDKGIITARISDPFNAQRFGFEFRDTFYYQDFTRKRQSRFFTIGFTYRFGELKDRDSRQRRDQSPREENDFSE